ncbi:MAG: acetolactate synthase [Opitutaceae bacterium]|nr:acetolactate synthase [Opitutaceae bacterium]
MDAETSTSIASDPVKQFSVFAESRVGRLYDLTALLAAHNIHVVALSTLDATDCAIVRLIVDDPDQTRELMVNNDFYFTESDILAVELASEAQLKVILAALLEAEINIHYVYSFLLRPHGLSALALCIEDADVAASALSKRGLKVLTQRDVSR